MSNPKSKLVLAIGLVFFILRVSSAKVYNAVHYGARGDGRTDSTKGLQEAWNAACKTQGKRTSVLIPEGDYSVGPLIFKGPCKSSLMAVELKGQLLASTDLSIYHSNWIEFQYIDGLIVSGGGRFNGQGSSAWPHNSCPKQQNCKVLPMSLVFSFVSNATISNISSVDSKFFHIHVFASKNMTFRSLNITAPGDSPNTDGIHIAGSSNVSVVNSSIGTGDDCVSVGPGSENLTVSGVACGPGHGISVGSLGKTAGEEDVVGVTVRNCTLTNTTNGLRIKTWQSSPSTSRAARLIYEDVSMNNVLNPIIIDQEYCPFASCDEKKPSLVKIEDVKFRDIRGSFASEEAIKFVCSGSLPCEGVELSDIDLKYDGEREKNETTSASTCVNVRGSSNGNVNPRSCI